VCVVFLAKPRHASEATFRRFIDLGAVRRHEVQWRDKANLAPADLARADVVCLKRHVDDRRPSQLIENPFPSFRGLPQAADARWDYLERIV
jgi:hypothetical protein